MCVAVNVCMSMVFLFCVYLSVYISVPMLLHLIMNTFSVVQCLKVCVCACARMRVCARTCRWCRWFCFFLYHCVRTFSGCPNVHCMCMQPLTHYTWSLPNVMFHSVSMCVHVHVSLCARLCVFVCTCVSASNFSLPYLFTAAAAEVKWRGDRWV